MKLSSLLESLLQESPDRKEQVQIVLKSEVGTVLPEEYIYHYIQALHDREEDFYEGDLADRIEQFTKYKLKIIPLSAVDIVYEYHEWRGEEYLAKFKATGTYPPIVVESEYMGSYDIIDGTHRATVLGEAGETHIKAWVGIE